MSPTFMPDFQPTLLWTLSKILSLTLTGLSPSMAFRSRKFQVQDLGPKDRPNTTSPLCFHKGFSLPYAVFFRQYSRHPNWFRFLQVLRCFNSLGSRWLPIYCEVTFGHSRLKGYLRLAGTYSSLSLPSSASQAKPST